MTQEREDIFELVLHSERLTLTIFDPEGQEDLDYAAELFTKGMGAIAPENGIWTASDIRRLTYSVMLKPSELNGRLPKYAGIYTIRLGDASGPRIGLLPLCRRQPHIAPDIGWMVSSSYRNKGYATEAAQRAFDYWTKEFGLPEMIATTDGNNVPSRKIAEQIGFVDGGWAVDAGDDREVAYMLPGMEKLNGEKLIFWGDGETPK